MSLDTIQYPVLGSEELAPAVGVNLPGHRQQSLSQQL